MRRSTIHSNHANVYVCGHTTENRRKLIYSCTHILAHTQNLHILKLNKHTHTYKVYPNHTQTFFEFTKFEKIKKNWNEFEKKKNEISNFICLQFFFRVQCWIWFMISLTKTFIKIFCRRSVNFVNFFFLVSSSNFEKNFVTML